MLGFCRTGLNPVYWDFASANSGSSNISGNSSVFYLGFPTHIEEIGAGFFIRETHISEAERAEIM